MKHTDENHRDYKDVSTALTKMKEVVDRVNEELRQVENSMKIAEVKSKLDNPQVFYFHYTPVLIRFHFNAGNEDGLDERFQVLLERRRVSSVQKRQVCEDRKDLLVSVQRCSSLGPAKHEKGRQSLPGLALAITLSLREDCLILW